MKIGKALDYFYITYLVICLFIGFGVFSIPVLLTLIYSLCRFYELNSINKKVNELLLKIGLPRYKYIYIYDNTVKTVLASDNHIQDLRGEQKKVRKSKNTVFVRIIEGEKCKLFCILIQKRSWLFSYKPLEYINFLPEKF